MGKKSKRRGGGGGGKKSASGSTNETSVSARVRSAVLVGKTDTPSALELAYSECTPLRSLKGIVSTNDDPGRCAVCPGNIELCTSIVCGGCCGKRLCDACFDADRNCGYAADILGENRCIFCNCLKSQRVSLLREEAMLGKPWAEHLYGLFLENISSQEATSWIMKSAAHCNPEATIELSELHRFGSGCPRDLSLAQAYAKRARSLHASFALACNTVLVGIAAQHIEEDGAVEEAKAILFDIAKEADRNALDRSVCSAAASGLVRIGEPQVSALVHVKSFCFGRIESALATCEYYFMMEKFALSKLWLSVACKTKSGFSLPKADGTLEPTTWPVFKQLRDGIRSKLRKIRDSCSGCDAALQGDTRRLCRGCRAYCYCSKECQKLHWNRADDGHRNECKESQEHARRILEAIRSGKISVSKEDE